MAWNNAPVSPVTTHQTSAAKSTKGIAMPSITRPRIFAATAFLGIAALLGTTAAVAAPAVTGSQPGMQQEGTSAMQGEGQPGMQQEGTLAMQGEGQPGMQHEIVLTAMTHDVQPGMQGE
jgi:hypothetical protein